VRLSQRDERRPQAADRARRFRQDLYFRIAVVEIACPPLRSAAKDVLPLAEHFRGGRAASAAGRGRRAALLAHDWPGNVRELQNRVQRALVVGSRGAGGAREAISAADRASAAAADAADAARGTLRVLAERRRIETAP
jgi:two-component system response regulator HydG